MNINCVSCLSEDILEYIIKKLEKEICDYNSSPLLRIYSYLTLKKLYKINKTYSHLFKNINKKLILSGFNLDNIELCNQDLRGIQFSHSSLNGALLTNCNLSNVNLEYCNMKKANLDGANLKNAILIGVDLTETSLVKTNFSNTYTKDIILDYVNLKYIYFDSSL